MSQIRWKNAPACEGTAHPSGIKGHDGGRASWVVHYRCDCGVRGLMMLCDGRVKYVLGLGEISCGGCGRIHSARAFWHRIEPILDPDFAGDERARDALGDDELVDLWAGDLRARACRPKTVAVMTSTMRSFAKRTAPTPLLAVTREQIIGYLGTEGWSPRTRRTYRTTLATFYDWAVLTDRIAANPAARLPRPRVPYSEPNPLSTEQIETLLGSGVRRRTRMMILLAAYQGLRASEISAVHGSDVDRGILHVPDGKGGTSLRRPLHPLVAEVAESFPTDGYWFPGNNGRAHVDGRSVSTTIGKAMRRAGITGHRPHQLRAWHATELIRAGVDAVTVQHSMRHATLGTLHKYVHPDAADVRSALSQLPRVHVPGYDSQTPEDAATCAERLRQVGVQAERRSQADRRSREKARRGKRA